MARSRLLIVGLAVTIFLVFWVPLYNCGPIWARRLEGQVIDKATGQPVPGAEVFVHYWFGKGRMGVDWRWVTTDTEGRFVFPGHTAIYHFGLGGCVGPMDRYPSIEVLHPEYGTFFWGGGDYEPDWSWRDVRIEVERDAARLEIFEDARKRRDPGICGTASGFADEIARKRMRCCEVLFGDEAESICKPPPGALPPGRQR